MAITAERNNKLWEEHLSLEKARQMKLSKMAKLTRIGKDIVMAKDGGPNPETNSRLRQVIQMPKLQTCRRIMWSAPLKASGADAANYGDVFRRILSQWSSCFCRVP